jgi:hypothetical protein
MAFTIVVLGAFVFAFGLGLFRFSRLGGIALLSVAGGASVGIRIAIIRAGLLFDKHGLAWVYSSPKATTRNSQYIILLPY